MQLDEKELKRLIEAVISVIKSQNTAYDFPIFNIVDQKEISVLFTAPWDNRFYTFTDEIKTKKDCCFNGFVSPKLPEQTVSKIKEMANWKTITVWNDTQFEHLENSISVFPVTSRDIIVKTALCISDTYETKWIRAAMEQGGKIILPRSGFERFTGNEPEKYKQKILSYYKDLLEMNIELPESFQKYIV